MTFLTTLRSEKIREASSYGRARWVLTSPLLYDSAILGETITVPIGFETDYASVPRIPMAHWLTGDTAHASAVVHDWLCTDDRATWSTAAKVFREAMAAEGVPA